MSNVLKAMLISTAAVIVAMAIVNRVPAVKSFVSGATTTTGGAA
jgi:hypothetical protein